MLNQDNILAKSFRAVRDCYRSELLANFNLHLLSKRQTNGRQYNLYTASEVTALIVRDLGMENYKWDVIVYPKR